jgi:hypothetical protein
MGAGRSVGPRQRRSREKLANDDIAAAAARHGRDVGNAAIGTTITDPNIDYGRLSKN